MPGSTDDFILRVLSTVFEHCHECDTQIVPPVRTICYKIGYPSTKEVWQVLCAAVAVGLLQRSGRGYKLAIELEQPIRIPIVGVLGGKMTSMPGARYVAVYKDKIMVGDKHYYVIHVPSLRTEDEEYR